MQLETYIPKGFLKELVSSIVFLSGAGTGVAFQRMYQVIIINLGHHFTVSDIYTTHSKREHTDTIWINGKQENTLMIGNSGLTAMYVIGLKPGMLPYLANLPAITTNNLAVGAEHWTSSEIFNLREQLLACRQVQSGFQLIEKYLTGLLIKKDLSNLEKVKWLSNAIHTARVEDICLSLGVTRKKLRSETLHYFGGSVKSLQGIIRFNHTLAAIAKDSRQSLSVLHPYYDQAHFINDFKARAGITPLQFKRLCQAYPLIQQTPNFLPLQQETFLQFIAGRPE